MLIEGGMTPLLSRMTLLICAEAIPAGMQQEQEQWNA
jgi:hypothetical protein